MLKMGSTGVNASSEINEVAVAFFNASFEIDGGYSISKNIVNVSMYNENKESCDADYASFEAEAKSIAEKIQPDNE